MKMQEIVSALVVGVVATFGVVACGGPAEEAKAPEGARTTGSESGGAAPVAGNWTLPERETWTGYQKEAKELADATNAKCGTKLTGAWNAESFRGHMPDQSPWARRACQTAFDSLQEICGQGDMQKAAVQKKFNGGSVECKFLATKGGGLEIAGNKLVLLMDAEGGFGGPNSNSIIVDQIKGKL
jgi:hypothetical protein